MDHDDIIAVIKSALNFIESEQQDDGSFLTLSSADPEDFSDSEGHCTIFSAVNILTCLNAASMALPMDDACRETLGHIRKKAAEFLMAEKSERWSFNYWAKLSKERATTPYPDDLDDTFRALDALYEYDKAIIDGGTLVMIVKLLTEIEIEPGGPYKTWLVGPNAPEVWRDIDIVVNSAIGRFLESFHVKLGGLEKYIENKISKGEFLSPYYPAGCHVAYFLSRFYSGSEKAKIVGKIFEECRESGLWANQLETAMAFSALMNLGFKESITEADVQMFVNDIKTNSFRMCVLCIDPSREGKKFYAGGAVITAAFIIEALSRWMELSKERSEVVTIVEDSLMREGKKLLDQTKARAIDECRNLPENLKSFAEEYIGTIKNEEIILVPYRMKATLAENLPDPASDKYILESLALGNLYGWMAYTIYDDVIDGDDGVRYLPAANYFLRKLIYLYRELGCIIGGFNSWCERSMNGMDNANSWEISGCRWNTNTEAAVALKIGDEEYKNRFAARSMAHALPAIGVLLNYFDHIDCRHSERDIRALLSFFRHYLIVKQLHDDAHDWGDDFSRGRMTPILRNLLSAYQRKNPDELLNSLDGEKKLSTLRQFFWREEIHGVIADIDIHIKKAREALARMHAIKNPEALASILDPFLKSAKNTLQDREQTLKFLDAYTKSNVAKK